MEPVYPLGVKKDLTVEPWWDAAKVPSFDPNKLLALVGAGKEAAVRHAKAFPSHMGGNDISFKLAGSGGDGAQTAALLLARASINEGFDATNIPSYGPESRGGTSYADVHIAEQEVLNPAAPDPTVLVAFNALSLAKFAPTVRTGGVVIYDSTVIQDLPPMPEGVRVVGVPMTQIAQGLERPMVKNIVALGAIQAVTQIFPGETFLATIRTVLKDKPALLPLNEAAFAAGQRHAIAIA